ncbi:MAG: hypothetical protein ACRENE_13900 [Polyangiaceae bacterium]
MSNGPLQDDWFSKAPVPSDRPGGLPSLRPSAMPPPRVAGDPMWSSLSGAVGGAVGVGAALLGGMLVHTPVAVHPHASWIVLAIVGGVALGAAFGRVTRRLTRLLPRVIFGAVASVSLCLVLYAFVLVRVAPGSTSLVPFQTSALWALVYGACLGATPLLRTRSERGRKL